MIDTKELRRLAGRYIGITVSSPVSPQGLIELLDRLEAAEKSDAESLAMYRKARDERDALRAKIESMEQQEPAGYGVRYVEPTNGEEDWDSIWKYRVFAEDHIKDFTQAYADAGEPAGAITVTPLYALPGAQNVPTSLLVAIADLVTQMEIVARVGFVDAPDDKDSCAAFCVAEGTWLELMSAVESLASALAAATEAKP